MGPVVELGGQGLGTNSSVKLVSSLRPDICFCVSDSLTLPHWPPPPPSQGPFYLTQCKVCMWVKFYLSVCLSVCLLFVGGDHLESWRVVHGHLPLRPHCLRVHWGHPSVTAAASCVLDRNQLSKQGLSVCWGLNMGNSHCGVADRDRHLASGPGILLTSLFEVFWCRPEPYL